MAFITGSHRYGKPTEESDLDLVILLDRDCGSWDEKRLRELSEGAAPQIRFGRLNLILCRTETEYAYWKAGTEIMARESRVNDESIGKKKAKRRFDWFRAKLGLFDRGDSGGEELEDE